MKSYLFFWPVLFLTLAFSQGDFVTAQKKFPRVRQAYKNCETNLNTSLKKLNIDTNAFEICLIAFKKERELELWVKNKSSLNLIKLKSYPFCALSGKLGPKNAQGDLQVPEGLYHIDRFNPYSNYHLSLGINYPNRVDRLRSKHSALGGDIFIHGSCVTIGCIPITDKLIEELYITCVKAKDSGQSKIPVYIFPFKMEDGWQGQYQSKLQSNSTLKEFWENLGTVYKAWKVNPIILNYSIYDGKYQLK